MKNTQLEIVPLEAFQDNYIWVVTRPGCKQVVVVDPGDATVVQQYLEKRQLEPVAILVTHYHWDHTDGINGLIERFPNVVVHGPAKKKASFVDNELRHDDVVAVAGIGLEFQVFEVPGHTTEHIAYYLSEGTSSLVFCGDTLFSVGCGRLFSGTAQQLHESLNLLATLSADTQVYCAHEYTLNNIEFALQVTPDSEALVKHADQVRHQREQGLPSLPSTMGLECLINPFLRVNKLDVVQAVERFSGRTVAEQGQVFAELRKWKDRF